MSISATGLACLISREALRTKAYRDSKGIWTIGVGHTSVAGPPFVTPTLTLTTEQVVEIFDRDLQKFEDCVDNAIKRVMAEHERDAFVSICFNIGQGAFTRSTFVKRFNAGDKIGCAKAIMQWVLPKEITSRREAERDQFLYAYDIRAPKGRSTDLHSIKLSGQPLALMDTMPTITNGAPGSILPKNPLETIWDLVRGKAPLPTASVPVATTRTAIERVQQTLRDLGYTEVGTVDGLMGARTRDAIRAARANNDLPDGTEVDDVFLAALPTLKPREESPARAAATKGEAQAAVPDLFSAFAGLRKAAIGTVIAAATGGASDSGLLDTVQGAASQVTGTMSSVNDALVSANTTIKWAVQHWWIFGLALGIYLLVKVGWAIFKAVVMFRTGRIL